MAKIASDKELMKETRKKMGLTQEQMAEEMGYATRHPVLDVEAGRKRLSGPARKLLEELKKKTGRKR